MADIAPMKSYVPKKGMAKPRVKKPIMPMRKPVGMPKGMQPMSGMKLADMKMMRTIAHGGK